LQWTVLYLADDRLNAISFCLALNGEVLCEEEMWKRNGLGYDCPLILTKESCSSGPLYYEKTYAVTDY
jgi:hypothetical protein